MKPVKQKTRWTTRLARVLFPCVLLLATGSRAAAQQIGDLDEETMAVLGRPDTARPETPEAAARAKAIDNKLRCPVCQGVSIADSPSSMATKMREQVRSLVAAGYTDEQVLAYFERSYGEFVRLEPPLRGLNWVLWSMPVIVLLLGGLGLFVRSRAAASPSTVTVAASTANTPASEVDPEMAKYLERIRRDSGVS